MKGKYCKNNDNNTYTIAKAVNNLNTQVGL